MSQYIIGCMCAWDMKEKGGRQASNLDLCRTSSDQHTTTAVCLFVFGSTACCQSCTTPTSRSLLCMTYSICGDDVHVALNPFTSHHTWMSIVANKASASSSSGTPLVRERDGLRLRVYSSSPRFMCPLPAQSPSALDTTKEENGGERWRRRGGMMDKSEIEG